MLKHSPAHGLPRTGTVTGTTTSSTASTPTSTPNSTATILATRIGIGVDSMTSSTGVIAAVSRGFLATTVLGVLLAVLAFSRMTSARSAAGTACTGTSAVGHVTGASGQRQHDRSLSLPPSRSGGVVTCTG